MINPFSIILFLTGLCFAIAGWLMYKYPPKSMNSIYGYRTPASMRSGETWQEANHYSSKIMLITGLVECVLALLFLFIPLPEVTGAFSAMGLTLLSAFLIIFMTERRLKKKF